MAQIEKRCVSKAKKLVREKFPELAGVEPAVAKKHSVSKGPGPGSDREGRASGIHHYVLTFEKDVSLPGGRRLKRLVRVTMDEAGEVVKLTSSK